MKKFKTTILPLAAITLLALPILPKAQTYTQFASSPTSEIMDEGTGQIGIGMGSGFIAQPAAKLHVNNTGNTDPIIRASYSKGVVTRPDYYFLGEHNTITGGSTVSYTTDFVVNNEGYVGIGDAFPNSPIEIKYKNYFTGTIPTDYPFGDNPLIQIDDNNGNDVFNLAMGGNGTTTFGAALIMRVPTQANMPVFVLHDGIGGAPMSVMGNGVTGFGVGMADVPVAQLNLYSTNTMDYILDVRNNSSARVLSVHEDGRVGIGMAAASATSRLSVTGGIGVWAVGSQGGVFTLCNTTGGHRHRISEYNGKMLIDPGFGNGASDELEVNGTLSITNNASVTTDLTVGGSIVIGNVTAPCTTGSCYSLYAEKGILTERVKVAVASSTDWSDFVFDKNYELQSLNDLKKYIAKNKHLPDVPSTEEVMRDGIDLGKMDAKLLQKIEELTLYVLELKQENEQQQQQITKLMTKN